MQIGQKTKSYLIYAAIFIAAQLIATQKNFAQQILDKLKGGAE